LVHRDEDQRRGRGRVDAEVMISIRMERMRRGAKPLPEAE